VKNRSKTIAACSILFLLLLHLPFLHSDPDYYLSIGRDAFTDEGLNTSQLRNYINHDYLDLNECDNLIKSPLFNLILFLPLKFSGTHLMVARLTVLLLLIVALLFLLKENYFSQLMPFLVIGTLTQFYVFQYSHFSLSEMVSVVCILLGIFFTFRMLGRPQPPSRSNRGGVWLPALFFSLAYYAKIQFAYIIVFLPAAIFILSFFPAPSGPEPKSLLLRSMLWLAAFAVIYLLAWYLPFRSTFDFVMKDQSSNKFGALSGIPKTIAFNIIHILFSEQTWWFNSLALICFLSGISLFRKGVDYKFKIMFVLSSLWMLIELHKLSMIYLPSRYLVGYYFAAGLMCTVVLHQLIFLRTQETSLSNFFFRIGFAITALFFIANSIHYSFLLQRRTYNIEAINSYFSSLLRNSEQPVMGPWAPTATWDCKARCIPVWKDFMNDKDVINRFHPQAILSEPNEDESNQAYSSRGISLKQLSDSTREFPLGRWRVIVYWMK